VCLQVSVPASQRYKPTRLQFNVPASQRYKPTRLQFNVTASQRYKPTHLQVNLSLNQQVFKPMCLQINIPTFYHTVPNNCTFSWKNYDEIDFVSILQ